MSWWRNPQTKFLRRAIFQVHLWTGVALSVYVIVLCVTGSVLVYRNELYMMFSPQPVIVAGSGAPMALDDLRTVAGRRFPGYTIGEVRPGTAAGEAVEMTFERGAAIRRRLFDPFTGADLGDPLPLGFRLTAWTRDLHDNLLYGQAGRRINGAAATLLALLSFTGAIVWWPGVKKWRRSLKIDWSRRSKRVVWSLHSALGFWFFAFVVMWAVTGMYLSFGSFFSWLFDYIEPYDADTPVRTVDTIQYWLAYLHFGRLGGRGIPGCGRGLCDTLTKFTWAVAALAPPVMAATGVLMWWTRVVRPAMRKAAKRQDEAVRMHA